MRRYTPQIKFVEAKHKEKIKQKPSAFVTSSGRLRLPPSPSRGRNIAISQREALEVHATSNDRYRPAGSANNAARKPE